MRLSCLVISSPVRDSPRLKLLHKTILRKDGYNSSLCFATSRMLQIGSGSGTSSVDDNLRKSTLMFRISSSKAAGKARYSSEKYRFKDVSGLSGSYVLHGGSLSSLARKLRGNEMYLRFGNWRSVVQRVPIYSNIGCAVMTRRCRDWLWSGRNAVNSDISIGIPLIESSVSDSAVSKDVRLRGQSMISFKSSNEPLSVSRIMKCCTLDVATLLISCW